LIIIFDQEKVAFQNSEIHILYKQGGGQTDIRTQQIVLFGEMTVISMMSLCPGV